MSKRLSPLPDEADICSHPCTPR